MSEEADLLKHIGEDPLDWRARIDYADRLEMRGDARAEFICVELALRSLPPDHPHRVRGEHELSRKELDEDWVMAVEPGRRRLHEVSPQNAGCACLIAGYEGGVWPEV